MLGVYDILSNHRSQNDEELKLSVDKFVNTMTSKSNGFTKLDGNKFLLRYESGKNLTFVIYDFEMLYDKKTLSTFLPIWRRAGDVQKSILVGWVYTSGGKSEFGIHPKKIFGLNRVFRVHGSFVDKKQRGKGFGKILYDAILNGVDVLVSDKVLYAGAFGIWTKYIHKKSKFFGAIYEFENTSIVIPIKKEEPIEKKTLSSYGPSGFIAITGKVPQFLQKLSSVLNGIDFNSLDLIDVSHTKFETKIQDLFDESISMDDLFAEQTESKNPLSYHLPYEWNDPLSPKALIYFKDALVFVKEVGDDLEWELL